MKSGGFCEVTKRLLLIERNNFLLNQKVKSEPVSDKNKLLVGVVLRKLFERITLKTQTQPGFKNTKSNFIVFITT